MPSLLERILCKEMKDLIRIKHSFTLSVKKVAFVYINWKFNFPFIYLKDWNFYVHARINYESEG